MAQKAGMDVTCFDHWLELTGFMVERAISQGITVFKALLHMNAPFIMKKKYAEAEAVFNGFFQHSSTRLVIKKIDWKGISGLYVHYMFGT